MERFTAKQLIKTLVERKYMQWFYQIKQNEFLVTY